MVISLSLSDLCCKWGFNDGDPPDWAYEFTPEDVDWHHVLLSLVCKHLLLEVIRAGHRVDIFFMESCHNPVRTSSLNGEPVDPKVTWRDVEDITVRVSRADVGAAVDEVRSW